jgi:FAD/FMN-containing dehydrogenase
MNPTAAPAQPFAADHLREIIAGEFHLPGDPGWDVARSAWNLAVDQHPAAVAIPADAGDVAAAVRFAREQNLRVCVQGTGHNAAAYGDLSDSILIKTERMREVSIDPESQVARVGAGVTWGEVVGPAGEHGLAALAGSSHDVGVVGYTLGGGVSWLARKHGLACERVTAVELVDAAGEQRRVTAESDPDLFWALRGGGGNFGVVTALEFSLLPLHDVYAGALFFPYERAGEVLEAWRRWSATVPDEVTSVGRMLQFPPMPEIPEMLRGRSFAVVEACCIGSAEQFEELLAPLRELGPEMDTFAVLAPADLLGLHMDPPGPVPGFGDHQMLADLDAASVEALVAAVGPGTESPVLSYEFRHLGGALGRRGEGSGALGALEGRYMTFGVGILAVPEMAPPLKAALARARAALDVVDSGCHYANFAEDAVGADSIYGPRTLARLREVKAAVDPDGLLHGNHPIDAAS